MKPTAKKPTELTQEHVNLASKKIQLRLSIEKRADRWVVLVSSLKRPEPTEVDSAGTYDEARKLLADTQKRFLEMLPGFIAIARDTEAPL